MILKCFKCGTTEGFIIKHHTSYDLEVIVDCCVPCHKKIHNRVRREKKCKYSVDEVNRLSTNSSNLRAHKKYLQRIFYTEGMMANVVFIEEINYNINSGSVGYHASFQGTNRKHIWIEDI